MSRLPLTITLDGPSGSGKSTASVRLAYHFGLPCLDTGAMYRFVAYQVLRSKTLVSDEPRVEELARKCRFEFEFEGADPVVRASFDGKPFIKLGREIRKPEVSMAASSVAKLKGVRQILVDQQREIGSRRGAVVEGRDAGTVIFPDAPVKFFVTASVEERAKRRHQELIEKLGSECPPYDQILSEMILRDEQDSKREASPLRAASDAIQIDTTGLDFNRVVDLLIVKVNEKVRQTAS